MRSKLVIAVMVALVVVAIFAFRVYALVDCTLAEYDLQRDTHFRLMTGRCTVDTPSGQVYLDSLRGFGDKNHDHSGDSSLSQ